MSRPDKEKRRRVKRSYKAEERKALQEALSLSEEALRELRSHLEREFALGNVCDHSAHRTEQWLASRMIEPGPVVEALIQEFGVVCDCELLANVRPDLIFSSRVVMAAERLPSQSIGAASVSADALAARLASAPKPWRRSESRPSALVSLALGKKSDGPAFSLLRCGSSPVEFPQWCRRRWEILHARRWRVAGADPTSDWARYGFRESSVEVVTLAGLRADAITIRSPRRTEAYQWWRFNAHGEERVIELETEVGRLDGDRRELLRLLTTVLGELPGC